MLEFLQQIDIQIFYAINRGLLNAFFDWLMPVITKKENGFPLWIAAIVLMLWKGGKKGRIAVLLVIPLITLSDQLSASVFKPLFERVRPCVALENVHLLVGMKTSWSFPSAHATNIFAAATYFSAVYPRGKLFYFILAVLVSLSRIYIGVHYPFDVLAGALLGSAVAWGVIYAYRGSVLLYGKWSEKEIKPLF
ncbi:phosphatase PAP2 family protein [candidate division KSB1 bacterium]|nr:phosphatase PAP2 family protein [candidate division KSB1 bacterium]